MVKDSLNSIQNLSDKLNASVPPGQIKRLRRSLIVKKTPERKLQQTAMSLASTKQDAEPIDWPSTSKQNISTRQGANTTMDIKFNSQPDDLSDSQSESQSFMLPMDTGKQESGQPSSDYPSRINQPESRHQKLASRSLSTTMKKTHSEVTEES